MAVKTREELIESINTLIGEDTSDASLAILEDFTDTYNDLSEKASDNTKWKEKYEENDSEWREKYRKRFLEGDGRIEEEDADEPDPVPVRYEDLFTNK